MSMSPVGVPDILVGQRLTAAQRDLKARLEDARLELSTGEAANKVEATNGDPMRLFALDNSIATLESRRPLIELARSRAGAMQTALESAQESLGDQPVDLLAFAEIGDLASTKRVARDAKAILGQVMSALNAQVSGRHVFGGDDAGAPPLAGPDALLADVQAALAGTLIGPIAPAVVPPTPTEQIEHYFGIAALTGAPAGTTFDENIYAGGAGAAPPVELAANDRLSYSVNANDDTLKKLMMNLALMVSIEGAPSTTYADDAARLQAYKDAAKGAMEANDAVTQMRADLGDKEKRIDAAAARSEVEKSMLKIARNDLIGRDEYETATLVKQLETQLQTVYAMTARTFEITLLNFLR